MPVLFGVAAGLSAAWFGATIFQQFRSQVPPREPLEYAGARAHSRPEPVFKYRSNLLLFQWFATRVNDAYDERTRVALNVRQ